MIYAKLEKCGGVVKSVEFEPWSEIYYQVTPCEGEALVLGFVLAAVGGGAAAGAAAVFAMMRRSLAASFVGEISEILNTIEAHQVESLADRGAAAPYLPHMPALIYRAHSGRIFLLGSHLARLIASFYAAVSVVIEEINALSSELTTDARKAQRELASEEVGRVFELGDEALRGLRDILSRRRHGVVSRA